MLDPAAPTPYMSDETSHVRLIEQDVRLSLRQSVMRRNDAVIRAARRRQRIQSVKDLAKRITRA